MSPIQNIPGNERTGDTRSPLQDQARIRGKMNVGNNVKRDSSLYKPIRERKNGPDRPAPTDHPDNLPENAKGDNAQYKQLHQFSFYFLSFSLMPGLGMV